MTLRYSRQHRTATLRWHDDTLRRVWATGRMGCVQAIGVDDAPSPPAPLPLGRGRGEPTAENRTNACDRREPLEGLSAVRRARTRAYA